MKLINGLKAIDVLRFFPFEIVVADLLDEILKSVSTYTSVENLIDDVFFLIVDYYRRWREVSLSRERIVSS